MITPHPAGQLLLHVVVTQQPLVHVHCEMPSPENSIHSDSVAVDIQCAPPKKTSCSLCSVVVIVHISIHAMNHISFGYEQPYITWAWMLKIKVTQCAEHVQL